tara:strand:- start:330 stop:608 length:279 start_codon:yes stop_codon:yes gene_type:complete
MSAMSNLHTAAEEFIKAAMESHYGDDAMGLLADVMLDADDALEAWLTSEFGSLSTDVPGQSILSEVFRNVAQEALMYGKVLRDDTSRYGGME